MLTCMFPGQGSQQKGMGDELFDEFSDLTRMADEILGYSIKELCLHDPLQQLSNTQYTQPALYIVNALSYMKKIRNGQTRPDFLVGHSLGEYNALLAAGAFDFETGLKIVKKRGELMSKAVGGGMAAVLGFQADGVRQILAEHGFHQLTIANDNAPTQIVIAGVKEEIIRAQTIFEQEGARMYIPLNVSGAFHSFYMEDAQREFALFLDQFHFSDPAVPVISNVEGLPYRSGEVKANIIKQITHQVKWTDTIRRLMGYTDMQFEEIGPGNVLTKLINQIRREAAALQPLDVNEPVWSSVQTHVSKSLQEKTAVPKPEAESRIEITETSLGDKEFKADYGLTHAYVTGAMYRGIASEQIVVKIGKAGMLGFYGTGGFRLGHIEEAIRRIQAELGQNGPYGFNLLHNPIDPSMEEKTVNLYLTHGVRNIEASAFMMIVPALVIYRAKGLKRTADGGVHIGNRIMAKLSRPEVAEAFLSPAPERIVEKLLQDGKITPDEASMLSAVPMADDLSAEADSGGHTDLGVAYALMPAIIKLRDEQMKKYGYAKRIRIGAAGGIGTPASASAAFMLGADYIVTGSINQCSVEANTSDAVKDLLQQANVQDTDYAPAGDMFELGAKVQVLKKGLFFPARANKLYDLYRQFSSWEEIDEKNKQMIQEKYFKRSFEQIFDEIKATRPAHEIEKAERNPKYKMAMVFKWYFGYTTQLALNGELDHKVDFQIHCGPALGAFNQWVKGSPLENWRNRHVDEIALKLMKETAEFMNQRFLMLTR